MENKLYLTFDKICDDIKILGNNILYSNQKYDAILTISGGGLIPARLLRNQLNIPIYSVGMSFYIGEKKKKQPHVFQWLREEEINFLKNRRVLIVDELSDTMGTINFLLNNLINNGFRPENMGVAVLYDKNKKKVWTPIIDYFELGENYFAAEIIDDKWVVFPWDNF